MSEDPLGRRNFVRRAIRAEAAIYNRRFSHANEAIRFMRT